MKELTGRQQEVLSFIIKHIKIHSYPPTIREIANHFEMSVKGAHDHVIALKRKGAITQNGKRSRTMEVVRSKEEKKEEEDRASFIDVPILGTVAAGRPIMSEENWDGTVFLHQSMLKKNKKHFVVRVRGDSMSGAGIIDGDMAVVEKTSLVNNGEIAVALLDDAITLKRFFKESGQIKLQAENPEYDPIYSRDVRIVGRLSCIIRSY